MRPATTTFNAPRESMGIDESFTYCERFTRSHYENFPVGSLLVPKASRRYVYAIYSFARVADDYADEDDGAINSPATRLAALAEWQKQLRECRAGEPRNPVFIALAQTIRDLDIPIALLEDLLSAFRQDVTQSRYSDFDELLDYCRRSANPVGRLVLRVFGYRDRSLDVRSDFICTALQLTNFWQDVSLDILKDRIYLPADSMAKYGITETDIRSQRFCPDFAQMLQSHVARTRELFEEGRSLCEDVEGRLRYELRLTWLSGVRVLQKIEAMGFNTLSVRPRIGPVDRVSLLARALFNRR